jgi:hypothetical protein
MKIIVCILSFFVFTNCSFRENSIEQNTKNLGANNFNQSEDCYFGNDTLNRLLFDLNFQKFDSSIIDIVNETQYVFNKSLYLDLNGGGEIYEIAANNNKLTFFTNEYGASFYIVKAEVLDNSINLNNGLEIGMTREQFNKVLKINTISCDTVLISDDNGIIDFIFSGDSLNMISFSSGL